MPNLTDDQIKHLGKFADKLKQQSGLLFNATPSEPIYHGGHQMKSSAEQAFEAFGRDYTTKTTKEFRRLDITMAGFHKLFNSFRQEMVHASEADKDDLAKQTSIIATEMFSRYRRGHGGLPKSIAANVKANLENIPKIETLANKEHLNLNLSEMHDVRKMVNYMHNYASQVGTITGKVKDKNYFEQFKGATGEQRLAELLGTLNVDSSSKLGSAIFRTAHSGKDVEKTRSMLLARIKSVNNVTKEFNKALYTSFNSVHNTLRHGVSEFQHFARSRLVEVFDVASLAQGSAGFIHTSRIQAELQSSNMGITSSLFSGMSPEQYLRLAAEQRQVSNALKPGIWTNYLANFRTAAFSITGTLSESNKFVANILDIATKYSVGVGGGANEYNSFILQQIKAFRSMQQATGMTANQLTKLTGSILSNQNIRIQLFNLDSRQRQEMIKHIELQMVQNYHMGLSIESSKKLIEAQAQLANAMPTERLQQGALTSVVGTMVGVGRASNMFGLMSGAPALGTKGTEQYQITMQHIATNFVNRLRTAQKLGNLGQETVLRSLLAQDAALQPFVETMREKELHRQRASAFSKNMQQHNVGDVTTALLFGARITDVIGGLVHNPLSQVVAGLGGLLYYFKGVASDVGQIRDMLAIRGTTSMLGGRGIGPYLRNSPMGKFLDRHTPLLRILSRSGHVPGVVGQGELAFGGAAGVSKLGRAGTFLSSRIGGRIAGMGLGAAGVIGAHFLPSSVSDVARFGGYGAMVGSFIEPGGGTLIGAGVGAVTGAIVDGFKEWDKIEKTKHEKDQHANIIADLNANVIAIKNLARDGNERAKDAINEQRAQTKAIQTAGYQYRKTVALSNATHRYPKNRSSMSTTRSFDT